MTIRLRLALFFTLLVGCTLVLVGTATYKLLRHGLLAAIERDVSERAAVFVRSNPHPLAVIMSNLDLLAKVGKTDPEFGDQALADIRGEANRMARMITQLLILGRADAGAQAPKEPVLLADIVAEACRQGQGMAEEVRFVTTAGDALEGVVVQANPDYLKQLLLILLDNAFKYTPRDGEVRVEAAYENGQVRITVADTGSGIDPADLPHIFERFYRGKNANGKSGTGLGLAIARCVAEQHGGSVRAESAPGRGSRFTVVLPVLERSVADVRM